MNALDVLRKKRDSLSRILGEDNPKSLKLEKSIKSFILEVDDIIRLVEEESKCYEEFHLVPKVILQREIKKSYFADVVYDGQFCEMILITVDENLDHKYLIYTTSISWL